MQATKIIEVIKKTKKEEKLDHTMQMFAYLLYRWFSAR
jgi:hypothetical protein